ncbi:hypothetical protein TNCV_5030091 [Trichonephila clavipes]|nr:hypothetical protein TNCV_5030091 [Trichonephila clavipes]
MILYVDAFSMMGLTRQLCTSIIQFIHIWKQRSRRDGITHNKKQASWHRQTQNARQPADYMMKASRQKRRERETGFPETSVFIPDGEDHVTFL